MFIGEEIRCSVGVSVCQYLEKKPELVLGRANVARELSCLTLNRIVTGSTSGNEHLYSLLTIVCCWREQVIGQIIYYSSPSVTSRHFYVSVYDGTYQCTCLYAHLRARACKRVHLRACVHASDILHSAGAVVMVQRLVY